jgi:hypothetical protein
MTRYVPLFLFICTLVAACGMSLRVHVPFSWFAYLVVLCLTNLLAFWSLARTTPHERTYLVIYALSSLASMSLAIFIAGHFSRNMPSLLAVFVCVAAMFWATAVLLVARWYLLGVYGQIPEQTNMILSNSWLLLVCGNCTILSLIVEPTALGKIFRLCLGSYWVALGYAGFCFSVGIIQYRALTIKLNLLIPAMIGIIAFGGLAWQLSGLQSETAREAVPQAMEVTQ